MSDELRAHGGPTLGKMLLFSLTVVGLVSIAELGWNRWVQRDVVRHVEIKSASVEGNLFCFSGWMDKSRKCGFALGGPKASVQFRAIYGGHPGVALDYKWRGEGPDIERPKGTTPIRDWCIDITGLDLATEIAGYVSHDCGGGNMIWSREFVRVTPAIAIGTDNPK